MTNQTRPREPRDSFCSSRSKLLVGLRVVPVAAMLFGIATMAPAASATACYQPSNVAVNGGRVSNETTLDLSADGGIAVSNANGGDDNVAVGGSGGVIGNGGNAAAGNGGVAVAEANGGMIDLDDINSGNNRGNTIAVSTGSSPCGYGPSNVAINGGTVSNETTLRLSADGGIAVANANGGDDNVAVGGPGGLLGNGGNARPVSVAWRWRRPTAARSRSATSTPATTAATPSWSGSAAACSGEPRTSASTAAPCATPPPSRSARTAARPSPMPTAATATSRSVATVA